jgi:hypothetical protein
MGDLGIRWQAWELLRAVGMLARELKPLGGVSVRGDRHGTVAIFDGGAVGPNRFGLFPRAHSIAQNLEAVVLDEPVLRILHCGFPSLLSLRLLAFLGLSALFGFDSLHFQLA